MEVQCFLRRGRMDALCNQPLLWQINSLSIFFKGAYTYLYYSPNKLKIIAWVFKLKLKSNNSGWLIVVPVVLIDFMVGMYTTYAYSFKCEESCKNFQYCYAYHSLVQKNDIASRLCASRVQCIINSATACENLAFDVTDGIIEFRSF